MSAYAEILKNEDPRIGQMFNVEAETEASGGAIIEDPFPGINALRERGGVLEGSLGGLLGLTDIEAGSFHVPGHPTYTFLSFSAVSRGLIENETFSSEGYHLFPHSASFLKTILGKIGADHRTFRDAIQPFFSPQQAQTWWNGKIIEETVEALISTIETKNSSDLFIELCARMPMHVVSAGFGLAPEQIVPFRMALIGATDHHADARDRMSGMQRAEAVLLDVITARRAKPENDIISQLVQAELTFEDGTVRPFTDQEIIDNCRLVMLAGGGTTWRQLGITLYALLDNQDQFDKLRADRSLLPKVILESARWHATDLIFPRQTTKDVEVEGVLVPKGAIVHLALGSANRDPSRWEDPDKFDIFRGMKRSLAFGGGPHSCLGQHVSRQEMEVALNAIMDRLPNLRWDESKPRARLVGGLFARGPSAIPVVFG
jgi:cytochrome P450